MSFITTKFQEILLSGFRGVALTNCFSGIFHFGQISKFKNWIKISCGYGHLHIMSLITTKFNKILLSGFKGVALTRKTGLTDWLTDGSKTLYPPQLIASGIVIRNLQLDVLSLTGWHLSFWSMVYIKIHLNSDHFVLMGQMEAWNYPPQMKTREVCKNKT